MVGRDPKGKKKAPTADVELPTAHPLSAASLRWNGTKRYRIERVENQHVKSHEQAVKLGRQRRDKAVRELVVYDAALFPCLPWLRPESSVSVPVAGGRASARVTQWSYSLGPGADPLTVGTRSRRGWGGR